MIYLDASSLSDFLTCQELFRLKWVEGKVGQFIAIHREAGIAVHKGCEAFWRGLPFEDALNIALTHMQIIPIAMILPAELAKWKELQNITPDILACYYDNNTYAEGCMVEHQWRVEQPFGIEEVTLVGRIDRFQEGVLYDVKTATEFGSDWKREYRESMLRDFGLSLYDWYLCQLSVPPVNIQLEVLTKPSERYGKAARLVRLDMPEIIAYRERFDAQLRQLILAVKERALSSREMYPWLMSTTACTNKYGRCPYLRGPCLYGINDKTLGALADRVEHLEGVEKRI